MKSPIKIMLLPLLMVFTYGYSQNIEEYSFYKALIRARLSSLESFEIRRQFTIDYWELRSFNAKLKPQISFTSEPFSYTRALVRRYDNENNIEVYREQQNLYSYGGISVSQNFLLTGATIYLSSSLDRLANFNQGGVVNYNAIPIQVGISQPIMAFNENKWEKKIAPLEYEKAKQDFLYGQEDINLEVVTYYFDWLTAEASLKLAKENLSNATHIYEIGTKKYELGTIEKDELLTLQIEENKAKMNVLSSEQLLKETKSKFQIYLGSEDLDGQSPMLPEVIKNFKIKVEEAIALAKKNNPEYLGIAIETLTSEREMDKAIKENRFDFSLNMSYGLNKGANDFRSVYNGFLDQQIVSVNFSIPIVDWGERRGNINVAKMTKELKDIELVKNENDFIQEVTLTVNNFNIQYELVIGSLETKMIAQESYDIIEKRFLNGTVDLLRLITARETLQSTALDYINSLRNYWDLYYKVQKYTLYNFIDDKPLEQNFNDLLEK